MTLPITTASLRQCLETFVSAREQAAGQTTLWRKPLLATARVDERFHILRRVAAHDHALPGDLLASARTVVVFFIPFSKAVAVENHKGTFPCRNWGLAYEATNRLIESGCAHLRDVLGQAGFAAALTPATHNFDHTRLVSRWSHKHLGYLAGLGRFGVNAQLITPAGCTGRLGSLVTDADLGDSPLVDDRELCLHKNGHACLICVKRCPVGAVSTDGIDRQACWTRLQANRRELQALAGLGEATHVCGKCQVVVPCSLGIPKGAGCIGRPPETAAT